MNGLGKSAIISVYGKKFNDAMAREYFKSIGLEIHHVDDNTVVMKNFTKVKRYTREEVEPWNPEIVEAPIGYSGRF